MCDFYFLVVVVIVVAFVDVVVEKKTYQPRDRPTQNTSQVQGCYVILVCIFVSCSLFRSFVR